MANKFNKSKVAVWCYHQWELLPLTYAKNKYLACMAACEGSEKERYTNIFLDINDIEKHNLEALKQAGFSFKKYNGAYYPVASDQDESFKNFDAEYFDGKEHKHLTIEEQIEEIRKEFELQNQQAKKEPKTKLR